LVFDLAWHGLNSDFNVVTVDQMVAHLSTVHLPLYIGVVGVLLSTAWALADQVRRAHTGVALPLAFAGAVVATTGEAWHAYSHLRLTTHSGPVAWTVALIGFVTVIVALVAAGRHRQPYVKRDVN
jgi:cytochrome bd-type quinol oxidase subunit 2